MEKLMLKMEAKINQLQAELDKLKKYNMELIAERNNLQRYKARCM